MIVNFLKASVMGLFLFFTPVVAVPTEQIL